ncbi:MAG TPA: MFS transporter [Leadbetterella sp.]|nr:MFS transporter [Leadbetterella sp.]
MLLKKAYGGLSPKIWLLALVMLINRAGTMVVAFMTVYTTQKLHFSIENAGFVMMTFGFGAILGSYLGGKLTDIFGYFVVQVGSLFLGGLLFFVVAEIQSFELLCASVFVLSAFGEAYRPANSVSIAHLSTPETFTRSISLVRLAINLGWAVGPVLGGLFATRDYKYLFWADGVTNIFAALVVLFFLKTKFVKKQKLSKTEAQQNRSESPWRDGFFMVFMLFTTIYLMSFSPLFTVLPVYYKEVCEMSEFQIGVLMGLNGLLVALVEMLIIYKVDGKFDRLKLIGFGCFLLVVNYVVYIYFTAYAWMLVGIIFGTFSEIFAMPFMNSFSVERAKSHNQGQYSAVYAMTWPIAQIGSSLLGTQAIARFGYDSLILFLGGLAIISTIGFYSLAKR